MANLSQKKRLYLATGIVLIIILLSFSIIFYGVFQVYFAPATLFSRDFKNIGLVEEYFEERIINVAVLGLHNRTEDNTFGDIYYVDTILIASINFDRDTLALLAVPRDSYLELACSGDKDRVRQAYSYGYNLAAGEERHAAGMRCTLETLDRLLNGLTINYYIAMDIQGLKQLIDSMGGVFFEVAKPMTGFTPRESLAAGPQILDGQGYINYLTYREPDTRDDLNRMHRQKELLVATFKYFQEMGLFSYVIPTYSAYRDHIDTDLSFNQIAALALFAGERLERDAILDLSLKGEYFTMDEGETYYLMLDEQSVKDSVAMLLNN